MACARWSSETPTATSLDSATRCSVHRPDGASRRTRRPDRSVPTSQPRRAPRLLPTSDLLSAARTNSGRTAERPCYPSAALAHAVSSVDAPEGRIHPGAGVQAAGSAQDTYPAVACQVPPGVTAASTGISARFVLDVGWCARTPGLTSVRDPDLWWADDRMFDGVIPLGEALRPLNLFRPSTRVACPQRKFGSRPRRISVSEDLPRTRWSKLVFSSSRFGP